MTNDPSSFVWYELMTRDVEAAEAFYRAVVGWDATDSGQPAMRYVQFFADGKGVAGLMEMPDEPGARPCWIGYLGVADVDAAAARLADAGGTVHRPPADIPNVGRFAVVSDPQGAVFALITGWSEQPSEAFLPDVPGHGGWHELIATDSASVFSFYAEQFGWAKTDALDMGPMGVYQLFDVGGDAIGGMMDTPEGFPRPAWLFYFNVDDIDGAANRIALNGGSLLYGPSEVPGGGWIVQATDPQGAMFALVGPRNL